MKKLTTILLTLCAVLTAWADAMVEIDSKSFDFGVIREADGPVSHTFTLTNTGDKPLVLTSVRAACGCTKPEYSKEPVAPGKTVNIKVTYLPAGRPGEFNRDVIVKSNAKNSKRMVLKIAGTVIPDKK